MYILYVYETIDEAFHVYRNNVTNDYVWIFIMALKLSIIWAFKRGSILL